MIIYSACSRLQCPYKCSWWRCIFLWIITASISQQDWTNFDQIVLQWHPESTLCNSKPITKRLQASTESNLLVIIAPTMNLRTNSLKQVNCKDNDYITQIIIDDCLYYLYGNSTNIVMRSRAHNSKSIFLNWLQQHIKVSSWLQTKLSPLDRFDL